MRTKESTRKALEFLLRLSGGDPNTVVQVLWDLREELKRPPTVREAALRILREYNVQEF